MTQRVWSPSPLGPISLPHQPPVSLHLFLFCLSFISLLFPCTRSFHLHSFDTRNQPVNPSPSPCYLRGESQRRTLHHLSTIRGFTSPNRLRSHWYTRSTVICYFSIFRSSKVNQDAETHTHFQFEPQWIHQCHVHASITCALSACKHRLQ